MREGGEGVKGELEGEGEIKRDSCNTTRGHIERGVFSERHARSPVGRVSQIMKMYRARMF